MTANDSWIARSGASVMNEPTDRISEPTPADEMSSARRPNSRTRRPLLTSMMLAAVPTAPETRRTGSVTSRDAVAPPYGNTHRIITSAPTNNGHSSLQAGTVSPKNGTQYVFAPTWRYLFGR